MHTLFQKIEEQGTLSNSFYEASTILVPKPKRLQENKTRPIVMNVYRYKSSREQIGKDKNVSTAKGLL